MQFQNRHVHLIKMAVVMAKIQLEPSWLHGEVTKVMSSSWNVFIVTMYGVLEHT